MASRLGVAFQLPSHAVLTLALAFAACLMYSDAPDAFAVLSAHEVLDADTGSDCNVLRVYTTITYTIFTLYVIHAMHDTKDDLRGYAFFFLSTLKQTERSEG